MNDDTPLKSAKRLTGEEVELLLSTIRDYTDQLRNGIDAMDVTKLRYFSFLAMALVLGPFLMVVVSLSDIGRRGMESEYFIYVTTAVAVGAAFAVAAAVLYTHRFRRSVHTIRRCAGILEVLVRRASQLKDRRNFDFSQKIYVDIGLADAESVLEQARRSLRGALPRVFAASRDEDPHFAFPL
jgi:hypothetical protein